MHAAYPVDKFTRIADRGRETDKLNVWRRTNNGLFPHGTTLRITEIVQLIKDEKSDIIKHRCPSHFRVLILIAILFKQHIAIHLGCHNDNRSRTVLDDISGHQPNAVTAVEPAEILILLVRESFERRRIHDTLFVLQGLPDGKFSHKRLTSS